ncbi:Tetratricopeptide repeat domain 27 [Verticillium nonalfalfae]|uniref:Tetratricopeptide repeat domain 27 n=1 Tax=Verticillium nonalfalfae TaxID=1051616 RepID=A0A3M9XZP8_9PEZI|nr:Tetratricopeptide repeat domain 27 [Verticillium nonalfalfae]RNJ53136.1 Tetratricopeptide repeat domain 27 [Verticillium nonalfalfae]
MAVAQPSTATPQGLAAKVAAGSYVEVLSSEPAKTLIKAFTQSLKTATPHAEPAARTDEQESLTVAVAALTDEQESLTIAVAALNAFLQSNVTGPVLENAKPVTALFVAGHGDVKTLRRACLVDLQVDGVAPYAHIPHIELFAFARRIVAAAAATTTLSETAPLALDAATTISLSWLRLRLAVWHYRLLAQPSLSGASFAKTSQWIDVPSLAETVTASLGRVRQQLFGDGHDDDVWALAATEGVAWGRQDKVQFLLEAANAWIMLGRDDKAREALGEATRLNRFEFALSGALGKRTRFQEKSISQLVVLARSAAHEAEATVVADEDDADVEAKPDALALNDDTLLETIDFSEGRDGDAAKSATLPAALVDIQPDDQPQLAPLDQIILLTEATLKDSFSPVDTLTSEEVLPYAVRVVSEKSTNWQIYTQALLVRSRIEMHRSRTIERGVLQMQAVVDQVVVDTEQPAEAEAVEKEENKDDADVPAIAVTAPDQVPEQPDADKPTTFFRAAEATDSAPAHVRLQYIHALASPPRWHLESELAYSWAHVGSLVSALEIFKRLRLWAEVALCLATAAAASADDESGRGSGGEEKAKGIMRWRLFHATGTTSPVDPDAEDLPDDVVHLTPAHFSGPERSPAVPNAPRLFCILGDLEQDPSHYLRAWEISNHRFARAQKSLGEYHLAKKDLPAAREAYALAVGSNRLSPELWSRLGDIDLRLGRPGDAAEAYRRAIAAAGDPIGGEDARTWSNLGSALWSQYLQVIDDLRAELKDAKLEDAPAPVLADDEEGDATAATRESKKTQQDPEVILAQSLAAYKRGATLSQDNWRIWDNVLTLATRSHPPAYTDVLHALRALVRIRASETALDAAVLRALVQDALIAQPKQDSDGSGSSGTAGVYEPPRGTLARAVAFFLEDAVVPLITTRSELWEIVARVRAWRRDYKGAVDAAEKGWRTAMGSASALGASDGGTTKSWLEDEEAWGEVVARTDELVGVLENYGALAEGVGERWRGKARSAVRSVMGKAKTAWEGSEGWKVLERLAEGLA